MIYLSLVTHLKTTTTASTVKKCKVTKATNVVIRCILQSDVTKPENYGLSENRL